MKPCFFRENALGGVTVSYYPIGSWLNSDPFYLIYILRVIVMNYSVLMSVYAKEDANNLKEAMNSIWNQTVPTNDFVLVCDGPLNKELEEIISKEKAKHKDTLNIIRLQENRGLGAALNTGLKACKNKWVGRMDSDDISLPNRFEKQLELIKNNPDVSICSAGIEEFGLDNHHSKRICPKDYKDIVKYSKRRCPFNHPTVIYDKEVILSVGGYNESRRRFEDYPLWIKLLKNGYKAMNSQEVLLKMRVSNDFYSKRGGFNYAKEMIKFRLWMLDIGWINIFEFISISLIHFIVCIIPNNLREHIYNKYLHLGTK